MKAAALVRLGAHPDPLIVEVASFTLFERYPRSHAASTVARRIFSDANADPHLRWEAGEFLVTRGDSTRVLPLVHLFETRVRRNGAAEFLTRCGRVEGARQLLRARPWDASQREALEDFARRFPAEFSGLAFHRDPTIRAGLATFVEGTSSK